MAKTVSAVIKLVDQFSNPSKEVARQAKNTEKRFREMGDTVGQVGDIFTSAGEQMTKAFTGPLAAVAGVAVNTAMEFQDAYATLDASADMSAEGMQKYKDVMDAVYKNNYGESISDVSGSLATLNELIPVSENWDNSAIQEVTESALTLKDTFGYEVPESLRAAKTLMDQFGLDATGALDMIAAGKQEGLDFSGEWLDSINEYSVQFEKLGMNATDMFAIYKAGADSGAFNLDKIGDAIKEFSIRAIDGSDTTVAGFEAIGLNADEMAAKFAAGGDDARAAFDQVISGLAEIEDPVKQSSVGVKLFGTMWEDLGPDAVLALNNINDAAVDVAGTMEDLKNTKYDTLSGAIGSLWRTIQTDILVPIGNMLIPYVEQAIDKVGELVEWWNSLGASGQQTAVKIAAFAAAIGPVLIAVGKLTSGIGGAITTFGKIAGTVQRFGGILGTLTSPVGIVVGVLVAAAVVIYRNWDTLAPLFELLKGAILNFGAAVQPIVQAIGDLFSWVAQNVLPIFEAGFAVAIAAVVVILTGLIETVSFVVEQIVNFFSGVVEFFESVFEGGVTGVFQRIGDFIGGIFDGVVGVVKGAINLIIWAVNGVIKGLNKIKLPDWVPGIGGKGINIPLIPTLYKGTSDWQGGLAEISEPQYGGEIVDLPKGTRVYPHDESIAIARAEGANAARSSGGKAITLTIAKLADSIIVREDADIERIADAIAQKLLATAQNQAIGVA